ncbi:MAG: recombination protein O N-terminal domain-containing protein [Candidatus Jorgensenbacteria bacterium]|nr:recombination protein O N-terminal domain-containing protein [Candidatus Jorgensenbacteria bacterium]
MREYATEAIVLRTAPMGEWDITASLFTEQLGRIDARAIGGKRIHSKFAQHLNPLNRVLVRLVQKNATTLADVVTEARFNGTARATQKALMALALINAIILPGNSDTRLWRYVKDALSSATLAPQEILKLLGHDPSRASCVRCRGRDVRSFLPEDQVFLCNSCNLKFPDKGILLIQ